MIFLWELLNLLYLLKLRPASSRKFLTDSGIDGIFILETP